MSRSICVVTGSRADYGHLYWLMKEIQADPALQLQVVVTGMHLAPEFGDTWRVIENDGFTIEAKVETLLSSDTAAGVAKAMGLGTIGFADVIERLRPDMMVVLGDRFEILAAAQAALVAGVPLAHIHGGEMTEGAYDESIRHALTKMSHLHFVAAEPYARRVMQMGEDPNRVFNFGAPGLDQLRRLRLIDRAALEEDLGIKLAPRTFLVTYHPVTLAPGGGVDGVDELLAALDAFVDATVVITGTNADTHGREVTRRLKAYAEAHPVKARLFPSLGQVRYLSLLAQADAVIGNSSSGIIEAPFLKTPSVNIGDRQKGRLRADSIVDCTANREGIEAAIKKAVAPEFRRACERTVSPYGIGDSSRRIKEVLAGYPLENLVRKTFVDWPTATTGKA